MSAFETTRVSQLSVATTTESEEPIAALLERIFGVAPTVYFDAEKNESIVTAYLRATPGELRKHLGQLRSGFDELTDLGLDVGTADVRISRVKREDWAESWKKHFKPITIGSSLLIKPSWSKLKPMPGQAVVVLDPGLSFGTGQHATTSFCLRQIVRLARSALECGVKRRFGSKTPVGAASLPPSPHTQQGGARPCRDAAHPKFCSDLPPSSLLDFGCGSGILAISAAKLGYAPVHAFDFDSSAVRIAQKNCRTNHVETKVSITRQDLTKIPLHSRRKYEIICANLMAPLLIAERDRILNRLAPGGTLILAGILATEFAPVRHHYQSAGLKLIAEKIEREWHSGAFKNQL